MRIFENENIWIEQRKIKIGCCQYVYSPLPADLPLAKCITKELDDKKYKFTYFELEILILCMASVFNSASLSRI